MDNEKTMIMSVNPLLFLEADLPGSNPSIETVVNFLCKEGVCNDVKSMVERYKAITKDTQRLLITPVEQHFLERIVKPLKFAIGSFMLGNYIGTISLCGMVSEMLTLLRFEVSNILMNNKVLTDKDEENLFGKKYEKLSQERRIKILLAYGLIDDTLKDKLYKVKETRNKYLHIYEHDYLQLETDAINVFKNTMDIVVEITGFRISNGKVNFNSEFLSYLESKGMLKEKETGSI